jgi:fatty-acyl-CoA synthase
VGDSSPAVLLHSPELAGPAAELVARCGVAHALVIDDGYESVVASGEHPTPVALSHDDPSTIMYTSGTTGHPKGAIITHGMTFWNAVNLGIPARITPDTVQLVVLPLFHTGGLNCYANPVLHAGGRIVVSRAFDPAEALRVIGDPSYGVTHFFAVPAPYQFMMQHPAFESTDLSRLQVAGVGGAPCALTILETWAARGVEVAQGYGMTETSPSSVFLDPADAIRKIGSAGKPVLHTEVRIVRPDGQDAAPGEVGELWTRGPNITPGYWNKPEATASAFEDGWFKTGDAARTDDDGYISIVDRWKDMYISGGENVYPAEVENVIYQLADVAEAAVIGVPDPKWGEVGTAVVVPKPGATIEAAQIIEHCRARLARFKVPARVEFAEALPRNATGKVLKRELRAERAGDAPAIT